MKFFWIMLLLVVISAGMWFSIRLYKDERGGRTLVFSPETMLSALWERYKFEYIEPDSGRTLDKQMGNITTSEGESYTLLRAVWQDDRETFDKSWAFTKDNLGRPNDHLFSWKFGERPDKTYGILVAQGGQNTASDADSDIALALIFAYSRWQQKTYLEAALPIINDIWDKEVIIIGETPYMTADDLEKEETSPSALVNPSYLSPYAYKIFARFDTSHPWDKLSDSSYDIIQKSMEASLDKTKSVGLVPNWITLNRQTAAIVAPGNTSLSTDYGYDALRTPWRLALDWQWFKDQRSEELLKKMSFLGDEWRTKGMLSATYAHDGGVVEMKETPAMYGGSMGYFLVSDPGASQAYYEKKLAPLYNPDTFAWRDKLGYYDDNLAWFGLATYFGRLPNLAESIQW